MTEGQQETLAETIDRFHQAVDRFVEVTRRYVEALAVALSNFITTVITGWFQIGGTTTTSEVPGTSYTRATDSSLGTANEVTLVDVTFKWTPAPVDERARAARRARRLLLRHLTPVQRAQRRRNSGDRYPIGVIGSNGGRYIIDADGAVYGLYRNGVSYFCIQPTRFGFDMPYEDHVLAKMLWIQANEKGFREIAIRSPERIWSGNIADPDNRHLLNLVKVLTNEVESEKLGLGSVA